MYRFSVGAVFSKSHADWIPNRDLVPNKLRKRTDEGVFCLARF